MNLDTKRIGLEHQIIVDQEVKEYEGFFENVFAIAEEELKQENELPNFLANCYLKNHLTYKLADKAEFIQVIKKVVGHHIINDRLLNNNIIEKISSMPHDRIALSPNLGAWWQKRITPDVIVNAVEQKDKKHDDYLKNTQLSQWLLLVIGSLKESSYEVEHQFNVELNTKFEKVFLLEDFRNRIFELK